MRYLIFPLILAFPALLSAKEIKVDYKDISYKIKHDKKAFNYADNIIKKEYKIKDCNKAQFEIFWAQYEVRKNDISSFNKMFKEDPISLTEDKKKLKINPHARFGKFLQQIPNQIRAFEINEQTKCLK